MLSIKIRKFFSYFRIILTAGLSVVIFHFCYMRRYSKKPEKYSLERRYEVIQKEMKRVLNAFRVDFHIQGLEKINKLDEKVLFISNHHSQTDPLILMDIIPKPVAFAAKKETLKMPFVGTVLRVMGGVALDRGNVMNQLKEIKNIVDLIQNEEKANAVIFAEGTRNKHPENGCLEFKGGSIKMGYMAKKAIVPISIYGSFRLLSINHYLKRYPVYIKFGDPIYPDEYQKMTSIELADKLRNQIDEDINRFRGLDRKEILAQNISKKIKIHEIKNDNLPLIS